MELELGEPVLGVALGLAVLAIVDLGGSVIVAASHGTIASADSEFKAQLVQSSTRCTCGGGSCLAPWP